VLPIPEVLTNWFVAKPTIVEVSSVGSINELIYVIIEQTVETSCCELIYPDEPRPWILLAILVAVEIYPAEPRPATVDGKRRPVIPVTLLNSCAELIYPDDPKP